MKKNIVPFRYLLCVIVSVFLLSNIASGLVRAEGNIVIRKDQNVYLYEALRKATPGGTFTNDDGITDVELRKLQGTLCLFNANISDIKGLGYATGITSLNLSNNYISDISPIKNLRQLESLDISKNAVTNIYPIAQLYNLEYLNISYNTLISNVDALANLTELKEIYMRENQVKSDKAFSGLTKLHTLIASDSAFTSVSGISKLSSLMDLDISGIPCKNYSPLNRIKNLNSLAIDARATDLSFLKGLKNLEKLTLNSVQAKKYDVLNSLGNNLKYLDLRNSSFANSADISNLAHLKYLNISSTKVSDISKLSKLGELEELYMAYNKISDIDVLANFSKLSFVSMEGNGIYDFNPLAWRKDVIIYGQNNYITSYGYKAAIDKMNAEGEMMIFGTQNPRGIASFTVGKNNVLTVPKGTAFDWISTTSALVSFQKQSGKMDISPKNINVNWQSAAGYNKDAAGTTNFSVKLDATRVPNYNNQNLTYEAKVTVTDSSSAQGNPAFKNVSMKSGNTSLFAYQPGVKEYDAYISDPNKSLCLSATLANSVSRVWKATLNGTNLNKIGSSMFVVNPTGKDDDKVVLYSIAQNGESEQITINIKQKALSAACDILKASSFDSVRISGNTIEASDKVFCSEKTLIFQISQGAFWEQYSDADCKNYISSPSVSVGSNGAATTYIKVISEDGKTSKVYTLNLKMPKKKMAVARPEKLFSSSTINGGKVVISLINSSLKKKVLSAKDVILRNGPKGVSVGKVKVNNNSQLVVTIKVKKGVKVKRSICGAAFRISGRVMSGGKLLDTNYMGLLVK